MAVESCDGVARAISSPSESLRDGITFVVDEVRGCSIKHAVQIGSATGIACRTETLSFVESTFYVESSLGGRRRVRRFRCPVGSGRGRNRLAGAPPTCRRPVCRTRTKLRPSSDGCSPTRHEAFMVETARAFYLGVSPRRSRHTCDAALLVRRRLRKLDGPCDLKAEPAFSNQCRHAHALGARDQLSKS